MEGIIIKSKQGWIVQVKLSTQFRPLPWPFFKSYFPSTVMEYSLHPQDVAYIQTHKMHKKINGQYVKFYLTDKIFDNPMLQFGVRKHFAKLDEQTINQYKPKKRKKK
jgi:hypothetical protein